jgi:hypothetical protein
VLVKTVDRIAVFNCDDKQRERGSAKLRGERLQSEWWWRERVYMLLCNGSRLVMRQGSRARRNCKIDILYRASLYGPGQLNCSNDKADTV